MKKSKNKKKHNTIVKEGKRIIEKKDINDNKRKDSKVIGDNKKKKIKKEDNKEVFIKLLKIFIITRIVLIIFLILSEYFLSNLNVSLYKHVFDLFDNEHYLNIAKNGYTYMHELAFFPLTPLLIRCLGKFGFLLLNQFCVLLSGFLFYLISNNVYQRDDNCWVSILYFISPISIFTCMFYSEAIFVFLTILAFYLYKIKKKYLLLGIALGLSVLNRSFGSLLFFTIFIFMFIDFIKKKERFKNILICYVPATIISCLYPIYLYVKTGNLFYFMTVQYEHWGRIGTNIFTILFDVFKLVFDKPSFIYVVDYIVVFSLIIYVFYFIFKYRNEKEYYEIFIYIIFSIVAICSTIRGNHQAIASFYRYLFACFPIYFMFKKNYINFILILLYSFFVTITFLLGIYFF